MDQCNDILRNGVFEHFAIRDHSEFRNRIRRVFEFEYDDLHTNQKSGKLSADITGLGSALLSLSSDDYKELRKKVRASQDDEFNSVLSIEIERAVASPQIVNAWSECMKNTRSGIRLEIIGATGSYNMFAEFALRLTYIPLVDTDPDTILLTQVTLIGVQMLGEQTFKRHLRLRKFSSLTQRMQRISNAPISLLLDFQGRLPVEWTESGFEAPIPLEWHRTDLKGLRYSQTFVHNTGPGRTRTVMSGVYRIASDNARIYEVEFRNEGENRLWNYHTTNGHGHEYEGDTTIIEEGRAFIWRRIWEGGDVTEYYTAYYEVWR